MHPGLRGYYHAECIAGAKSEDVSKLDDDVFSGPRDKCTKKRLKKKGPLGGGGVMSYGVRGFMGFVFL